MSGNRTLDDIFNPAAVLGREGSMLDIQNPVVQAIIRDRYESVNPVTIQDMLFREGLEQFDWTYKT